MLLPPPARSLWRDQKSASADYPALAQDCAYDIAIIGGGYTGLHAALTFAEAGLSVVVLEAGAPGTGGSGRSGGVVSAKVRRGFNDIARSDGLEMAKRMHAIATGSVEHLTETISRLGLSDTGFRRVGALKCAHSARAFDHARQEADWLRDTLGDTGLPGLLPGKQARTALSAACCKTVPEPFNPSPIFRGYGVQQRHAELTSLPKHPSNPSNSERAG